MSDQKTAALSPREFARKQKEWLPGRTFTAKDIGRLGTSYWRCDAVTLMPEGKYPKVLCVMRQTLQRIEGEIFHPGGEALGAVVYRFGYYTIARNEK